MNISKVAAFLLLVLPWGVIADEAVVAYVKTVTGSAAVVSGGTAVQASPGTPVYMKNTLKTGPGSTLGITFKDNTVMSLGPDTELTVDEFLYAPAKEELSLVAKITRGTLEYLSGVIAKLKPEAVAIKTPGGMIGVRGTRFLVKVEELPDVVEPLNADVAGLPPLTDSADEYY